MPLLSVSKKASPPTAERSKSLYFGTVQVSFSTFYEFVTLRLVLEIILDPEV